MFADKLLRAPAVFVAAVGLIFASWAAARVPQGGVGGNGGPGNPNVDLTDRPIEVGPIDGLTTAWHPVPRSTGVPSGVMLRLRRRGIPLNASVQWVGAREIGRLDGPTYYESVAECPVGAERLFPVLCTVRRGSEVRRSGAVFQGLGIELEDVALDIRLSADPIHIDYTQPLPEQTMDFFFAQESIARLSHLDRDSYATSVGSVLTADASVYPAELAPLLEWRLDGVSVLAGSTGTLTLGAGQEVGWHSISAGPVATEAAVDLVVYDVSIVPPSADLFIPESTPIMFEAVTDPPGFEDRVTWLASTKYGTSTPVLGRGPRFVVRFEDPWGPGPGGEEQWSWLGVKADNAALGTDQAKKFIPVRVLRLIGPPSSGINSPRTPDDDGAADTLSCLVACLNSVYGTATNVCFTAEDAIAVNVPANTDGVPGNEFNGDGQLASAERFALRNYLYSVPFGLDLVPKGTIVIAPVGNLAGINGIVYGGTASGNAAACESVALNDNLSMVDGGGDCRSFAHEVAHSFCCCHCSSVSMNIMTSPRATTSMPNEVPNPPTNCPNMGTASNEVAFSSVHRAKVREKACDPMNTLCQSALESGALLVPPVLREIVCEPKRVGLGN